MTTTAKAPRKSVAPAMPKLSKKVVSDAPEKTKVIKTKASVVVLVIGGEPRVHLLPPQVIARKRGKVIRRRLGLGLVGVVVLVVLAIALATFSMISAQAELLNSRAQTTMLLQQQVKYSEVLRVKADASSIQSSQKLATAQEIAWQPFIADVQNTLPAGGSITSVSASIDTPFAASVAVTTPLEGPRIATINVTAAMPQSTISGWLDSLTKLKGFVDATPNSVTAGESGSSYVVTATIHINDGALENRFTKAGK